MRGLDPDFVTALADKDRLLSPVLERVKQDHTLMLAIRKNYINIYYRGGNLLRVAFNGENSYTAFFDPNYSINGKVELDLPSQIQSIDDAKGWVRSFSHLKEIMDMYFAGKSKSEREFQQLVARENNFSTISNESEYFFSDIEFADSELGARFDLLAIRWLASQRKNGANCRAAFVEMKYGDGALGGTSGLVKHLDDITNLVSNEESYPHVLQTMESQFNQLDQLGLMSFNRAACMKKIKIDREQKPEVIILLANHNPRSTKLSSILNDEQIEKYAESTNFDLKFFVASFSGYAFHADCMKPLSEFRRLL